jgi:hypothetical protein
MTFRHFAIVGVCLSAAAAGMLAAPSARAQQCTSTQDAAVECFVSNAVKTNLTSLRYGMSMAQFKAYGVSVSKILQSRETYLVLAGISAAVADAMPPTNANGSANSTAQDAALTSIVQAEVTNNLVTIPAESTQQDLIWFSEDMTNDMNQSGGILMSPGFMLRVIDGYVVAATTNGTVNWSQVDSNISGLVSVLQASGLLKLPSSLTAAQVTTFAESVAQIIVTYKTATGRTTL